MSTSSPEPSPWTPLAGAAGSVSVDVATEGGVDLVRMTGEVDDELSADFETALAELARRRGDGPRPVLVEATAVSFMDSSGASFLAKLAVAARPERVTVRPSEPVGFLLGVTRLSDILDVVPSSAPDTAPGATPGG